MTMCTHFLALDLHNQIKYHRNIYLIHMYVQYSAFLPTDIRMFTDIYYIVCMFRRIYKPQTIVVVSVLICKPYGYH
jgi:hypothetical protein